MDQKNRYAVLRGYVIERGLLQKQPLFYTAYALLIAGFWALGAYLILSAATFPQALGATVFLAFTLAQTAMFFHDAGHKQIAAGPFADTVIDIASNVMTGISMPWWRRKHNQHHAHPNHETLDPDVRISMLSFSQEQAKEKKGFAKVVSAYQHIFIIPLLFLELWHLRVAGLKHILSRNNEHWIRELMLTTAHFTAYVAVWFLLFPPLWAIALMVIHHGLTGMYLGSVFATNHKGLPLTKDTNDFLTTQVLMSRNVKGGALTTFLYGGLNYQIEHHLFPAAPRNKLRQIRRVVMSFCREQRIPYREMNPLQSYQEIYRELKYAAAPLRVRRG